MGYFLLILPIFFIALVIVFVLFTAVILSLIVRGLRLQSRGKRICLSCGMEKPSGVKICPQCGEEQEGFIYAGNNKGSFPAGPVKIIDLKERKKSKWAFVLTLVIIGLTIVLLNYVYIDKSKMDKPERKIINEAGDYI